MQQENLLELLGHVVKYERNIGIEKKRLILTELKTRSENYG